MQGLAFNGYADLRISHPKKFCISSFCKLHVCQIFFALVWIYVCRDPCVTELLKYSSLMDSCIASAKFLFFNMELLQQ
jgi:hypothetical protein